MEVIQYVSHDCFAHHRKILNFFGISTNTKFLNKLYAITLLVILTIYPFMLISEIVKLRNNFDEFINSLMFALAFFIGVISVHGLYWNKFALHKLFDEIMVLSDFAKSFNNKDSYLTIQNYENFIRKQGYGIAVLAFLLVIVPTLVALLLSLQTREWILPFGSGIFIENGASKFFIQIFTFFAYETLIDLGMLIYISKLALVSAHCQHLQKYIKSLFKTRPHSLEENKKQDETICWTSFKTELKKVVDYHTAIIDRSAEIEKTFCVFILSVFGGISLCLCCLLYYGMTLNPGDVNVVRVVIYIVDCYLFLAILSFWGDKVLTESSKIATSCYDVDFVGLDVRIQKSLLIIQSQKPIKLTIGKIRVLCLPTMVVVFKSIYSYYALLRNIKNTKSI